jgi:hypothetical protein
LNQIDNSDSAEGTQENQQRTLTTTQRQRTTETKKPLTKRVNIGAKRGDGNGSPSEADGQNVARTEYISYIFSLLRSYSAENGFLILIYHLKYFKGDDLPVLELNALRDLTFITEAYLFHICFVDQLEHANNKMLPVTPVKPSRSTRAHSEIYQETDEEKKKNNLKRFFKRSSSISYSTLRF